MHRPLLALALVALLPAIALAEDAAPSRLVLVDGPDGPRLVRLAAAADGERRCPVDAPTVPRCAFEGLRAGRFTTAFEVPEPFGFTVAGEIVPVLHLRAVSIVRGGGSEFSFACDLHYVPASPDVEFRCLRGRGAFPPPGAELTVEWLALLPTDQAATAYDATGAVVPGLGRFTGILLER